MAPIIPDPSKIKSFRSQAALAVWMKANHARETELWLKIHKKGSGLPTVTNAQALDVALCWGWIDGIRKSFDETSFLQRYTPRRARSLWSQINRDHVARLTAAGDRPSRRPAPARLPSSRAATKTFIASIRSIPTLSRRGTLSISHSGSSGKSARTN